MKKILIISIITVVVLSTALSIAIAGKGNNAPSGKHYNLNIIGVPHEMKSDWSGGQGSRIFVDREASTTFYVYGGNAYEIKDRNGTDGYVGTSGRGYDNAGIVFPYNNGEWKVKIYVRLVGPRDSSIHWKSDYFDGSTWLIIDEFDLNRENKKFQMKTNQLLKDGYQDIIWTLSEKEKFRIIQMRIYLY
jgi:hypothetical protein